MRPAAQGALPSFATRIVAWHARHGRHDLPWQGTGDPYRIWLSEIMLQQTQVRAVIPYYQRFLAALPDIAALAAAPADTVLALWSGLGYYRRAHHLHAAARVVMERHAGIFPRALADIAALPGIGRSTAAAIAAFAFGERAAILDGNVKRVLARHRGIEGYPGEARVESRLWAIADAALPAGDIAAYTQAMMDLGATVCLRQQPRCMACPVADDCVARSTDRIGALPSPRPVRVLPQRVVRMLVVQSGARVLLERRPDRGIWSGLWSLPELDLDVDVRAACVARYGVACADWEALHPIEHAFTHYRLTIHPVRIVLDIPAGAMEAADRAWVCLDSLQGVGIPAPVRGLLRRLHDLAAAPDLAGAF